MTESLNIPTFSHTILYVDDVRDTLQFFQEAFGFQQRFLHESGEYGELETGGTALAFASRQLIQENLGDVYAQEKQGGCEICLTVDNLEALLTKALKAGSTLVKSPTKMPWGQTIAYIKTPQGILVEFGTPLSH